MFKDIRDKNGNLIYKAPPSNEERILSALATLKHEIEAGAKVQSFNLQVSPSDDAERGHRVVLTVQFKPKGGA